jgi:ankyrin repeat protein
MQTFKTIKYKGFKKEKNTPDLPKTIAFLQNGDFQSAESKKLVNTSYFRAKIDYENRLIFTFLRDKDETYIALLEVILNHDYNKSQFLRDKKVKLEDFIFEEEAIAEILLNPKKELRYLDKFISFSDEQENILKLYPPLLIIGSAGSGKTSVAIEKLKELEGKVLYISLSKHLVDNSKSICGKKSNIDFYSFDSFLNRIEKQDKKEIDFNSFKIWALKNKIRESEKYFEEFKGVLTANHNSKYILEDEYISMGIKQSLFKKEERTKGYQSFMNYLKYLEESNFYDANIVIFDLLDKIQKVYDFIIIDEVQDFTNKEIYFISQSLKNRDNIIFSGDSNQIIYSNFFSWSNLKTMLFDEKKEIATKILTQNYRNSQEITKLSNKLLKIKQLRFGSIDKESNYLIESSSVSDGNVHFYKTMPQNIQDIKKSKDFAVIVFDETEKREAKKIFNTELTFTVREAKGLEYQNIVLFNFITNHSKHFFEIVKDISKKDLESNLIYNRQKDKENRDLETYKITINSLYVALTRGIESLYILESKNHKLLELLDINKESTEEIEVQESTKEEWLEEAKRLNELGRAEQANEIEENIDLKVVSQKNKNLAYYEMKLFGQINPSNSIKNKLFKLAKKENDSEIIEVLAKEIKFSSAMKYLNMETEEEKKKLFIKESQKIFNYAEKGNLLEIKNLIDNGVDINLQNNEGVTALILASTNGNKEIVRYLIDSGANLDIQTKEGITALMCTKNEHKEVMRYLIDSGANLDIQSKGGVTVLMWASKKEHKELVRYLIDSGANLDIQTKEGITALMFTSKNEHKEVVRYLIDGGANLDIQAKDGVTVLMIASTKGNKEVVRYLIDSGANLNIQTKEGESALILASTNGNKEIVKLLKENGAK